MPGIWGIEQPRPIINRDFGEPGFKKRGDHAGTMRPCKHCGKPTYRTVGTPPVCVDCTKKEPDPWSKGYRESREY